MNAWICAPRATDHDLKSVSESFCANAWMCAWREMERDVESVSAKRRRMFGCVRSGKQTVMLIVSAQTKKVNAWIRAPLATHHDLVSVIPEEKRERERSNMKKRNL